MSRFKEQGSSTVLMNRYQVTMLKRQLNICLGFRGNDKAEGIVLVGFHLGLLYLLGYNHAETKGSKNIVT